jgi:hypothetical protein
MEVGKIQHDGQVLLRSAWLCTQQTFSTTPNQKRTSQPARPF